MNIVSVLGSPRKNGNSSSIAKAFTDEAASLGAEVTTYYLNGMECRGCQGCHACKTTREDCILRDDLTELLEAIHEADIVVLASPVYYFDLSGQFKLFLDRTYSYLKPDFFTRPDPCRLPAGKQGLFILSQGAGEEEYQELPAKYGQVLDFYGFREKETIRAVDLHEKSGREAKTPYMEQAEALARKWCR